MAALFACIVRCNAWGSKLCRGVCVCGGGGGSRNQPPLAHKLAHCHPSNLPTHRCVTDKLAVLADLTKSERTIIWAARGADGYSNSLPKLMESVD